jgi:flavin-dependent thymidylate synthase
MRVNLAGFNLDTAVIKRLGCEDDVTPETLSAAYARISRYPDAVPELRRQARREVEKARKSNRTIVFEMGHHSVAEHAVFNFDILGISRLALEALEHFRLASYTEKSQRYIRIGRDYVLPTEITGDLRDRFRELIARQFELYVRLYRKIYRHRLGDETSQTAKRSARLVASEDARYVLPLATLGQVGMTVNARNLELMIRRFASHPLTEVRELGARLRGLVSRVAPSLIIFAGESPFDSKTYAGIQAAVRELGLPRRRGLGVRLVSYTKRADDLLLATILHHSSTAPFEGCRRAANELDSEAKRSLLLKAFEHAELYDAVLREFEVVSLTFELVVSASCFAQLKRHRLATVLPQGYDPELGIAVPESIHAVRATSAVRRLAREAAELFGDVLERSPDAAPYVLTNGHRRRVLFHCNARELYHVSRLRQDQHAQWEIRELADAMAGRARKAMPLTCLFLGGKDAYPDLYRREFGRLPRVVTTELPEARPTDAEARNPKPEIRNKLE